MPQATLQVRQTTTTTTSRASVLVINTGYLTTKLGILKLILLILSLICFILLLLEANYYHRNYYGFPPSDMFLTLVTFGNWFTVTLMLIAALLSLGTSSLLPKLSYDFIFHSFACILYFIGGLWVSIGAFGNYERHTRVQAAAILALICGVLHLVHGVFSYRLCITN